MMFLLEVPRKVFIPLFQMIRALLHGLRGTALDIEL